MKVLFIVIFISTAFFSCRSDIRNHSHLNIAGDYQLLDSTIYNGAELRLRKLDENAYVVKLNEAAGIGKFKEGILFGTFKNKYGQAAPFTLEIVESRICILRAKNRTLSFIKKS